MTRWTAQHGDILNEPADVLVCSANVFLNLSGGVGGEILLRYGEGMQQELHAYLRDRQLRFVQQGEVVPTSPCGTPFKAVLHAVAVDGFYQSSPSVVQAVVAKSLKMAAALDARRVALTALATGYGRLPLKQFAEGIRPLLHMDFRPVTEVAVCVKTESDATELAGALAM